MTKFIEYLKESSDCLYIYDRNFSIYGLPDKERYTIVVNDDWICPEDWIGYDNQIYQIYDITTWFNLVLKGNLICWECACLNKKYVIKEYVKLIMNTNPLLLRKYIDSEKEVLYGLQDINGWKLICDIKFVNQIIENHKIVNFKEASSDFYNLENYDSIFNKSYDYLKKLTDGALKKEQLDKINKNGKHY